MMRFSPELKRVLEVGSTQVINWIEQAQSDGYSLKSLESAQDFLHICIQALKHEKVERLKKKNAKESNVHFLCDYKPKGPSSLPLKG